MRRFIWFVGLLLGAGVFGGASADTIYLKSGGEIQGEIIYRDKEKLKLRIGGKAIQVFKLKDIVRIERDDNTGDDYFKRKSGVKGGDTYNPYGKKGSAEGGAEGNPWEDTSEIDEETQARIDQLIIDLTTRQDNRYLVRAKNKLVEIGFPAGRALLAHMDNPKPKVRQGIVEILRDIDYKPAAPLLIAKSLRDDNGFTREAAIQALEKWTGKSWGYGAYNPLPIRERAITRWEAWWAEEEAKYLPEEPAEVPEGMKKKEGEEGEKGEEEEEEKPPEEEAE